MQRLVLTVIAAFALFAFAHGETTCESHRRNSQTSAHGMSWNIQCDQNGDYLPLQCTNDTERKKWCACYNKEEAITSPSRKTRTCVCPLDMDEQRSNGAEPCELPKCENTGKYKTTQCCAQTGMCHCVNAETGERTTEKQNNPNLQCPN